ncbi:hypothetical protein BCR43DRAFT_492483 [Syncephalastrum racemosum]|uniref:Uncharacterized protein n=1 Tax=Syncephalastrum racemosum TaxID=13706 RepID=A0A1X2HDP7_SYNRA|nr:hypothetical protein BCR43DRAFT_492483 [Syncephalastrum racemosum]
MQPRERNPVSALTSLPQLAIAIAILVYATHWGKPQSSWLLMTALAGLAVVSAAFVKLQLEGASYRNWEQNPNTRQTIQVATLAAVVTVVAFHASFWSLYGFFTPVLVAAVLVGTFSLLHIFTAVAVFPSEALKRSE